jgi:hypothetical protein
LQNFVYGSIAASGKNCVASPLHRIPRKGFGTAGRIRFQRFGLNACLTEHVKHFTDNRSAACGVLS